ncbi:serine/threonine-protein phosphatase 7 long form [Salvia divinorum]|uniref:Serine/threonine-protein phosphatase 7 long form n=1 Tax=Salvia divinorum TaxID=28513 RepID=A0ABD1I2V4_SALDI
MWAWERIPNIRPELVGAEEYDGTTPCASIWTGRLNVGFSQSYFREQLAHLHDNQFIWEPPGIHGQPGIHEIASTHQLMTLANVYHCLNESETVNHPDIQNARLNV